MPSYGWTMFFVRLVAGLLVFGALAAIVRVLLVVAVIAVVLTLAYAGWTALLATAPTEEELLAQYGEARP